MTDRYEPDGWTLDGEKIKRRLLGAVGGDWNGNQGAFNDSLSWPEEKRYEVELRGSASCGVALGHRATQCSADHA